MNLARPDVQPRPSPAAFGGRAIDLLYTASAGPSETRPGLWLNQLQAAWYAGEHALARRVVDAAGALSAAALAPERRLCWHLFAALALSGGGGACARDLALHCAALRRLPDAGHASALAQAARLRHAGKRLAALRAFDGAGAAASRDGRHWLAALAWEQAAPLAGACGLHSAVGHYRQQAIAACRRAGADGRAEAWRRRWDADAPADKDDGAGGIGDIGLSIAHEINQPLAAVSLHAAAARKWLCREQPDIARALASLTLIDAAGRHAGDIVRSVQQLATRCHHDRVPVPVDQAIAAALQLLRRPLRRHGIALELALGLGDCMIHASRVQLQQVVTNLVTNAIEALSGHAGPARRIEVRSRRAGEDSVEISVIDNGPGIAPADRCRVFGSLFSTKPNGTGMGLSISLAIVRAHGGAIDHAPAEPHGACFRVILPLQSYTP